MTIENMDYIKDRIDSQLKLYLYTSILDVNPFYYNF